MKKTGKAVFTYIVILAVTAALIPSVCLSAMAAVWNGGTVAPAMNAEGYYLIDTGEKLAWFSSRVNSGYTTIKAKQTADIDLGGRAFTPIGTATNVFLGVYDGGGYEIANLYITGTAEKRGLFACIGAAKTTQTYVDDWGDTYTENTYVPSEINNVVLVNANVNGTQGVGGIAADSDGGAITGCSVSGTITGTLSAAGGIVGYNHGGAVVSNCLNSAAVNGAQRVGGIAGYCYSNAEVKGCCNEGSVSGQIYVGGLVGMTSGSTVHHGYNKGNIQATGNQCGGLLGYALYGEMYCMYTLGTVTCPGEYTGIAIGNTTYGTLVQRCYYDRDNTSMTDNYATAAENALMLDSSFLGTLNPEYDIFVGDYFLTNGGYPVLRWQLIAWDGSAAEPQTDTSGTYLISNGSELAWFAKLVNGTLSGVAQNAAANARMVRDVLLNAGTFGETSNIWTPIGTVAVPYTGSFDGGEYRISGIYANDSSNSAENIGLFGVIGTGGMVQNLFIENSQITGQNSVGMIAGINKGTIQNCFNYGIVHSAYYAGGIAGVNEKMIQNCGNCGEITGNYYTGGITGSNDSAATVQSCFNMGSVTAPQRTGGILGTNYGMIQYCYNAGTISGGSAVGGVIGYQNSTISYGFYSCYNIGHVSGLNTTAGAVVGSFVNGNVYYCYYDSDRSGIGDRVATGKTTADMATPTSLSAFTGFSSSYWIDRGTDQYFDYCPELRIFYNSNNNLLKTTSKESAAVLKSNYVVRGEEDGELPAYYESLSAGSTNIGTGSGTLYLLKDIDIADTVNVTGEITVTDNGTVRTAARAADMEDSLFNVEGILKIKGSADSAAFCIDGGNGSDLTGDSAVWISATGTLILEDGAAICDNTTTAKGGGIYIDGGTLEMHGGDIIGNQAVSGGGIYNYAGIFTADGGNVSGNTASSNGGGICFEGRYAENTLDGLTICENTAQNGGGICNINSPVQFLGGEIADNTASLGGGAYNAGTLHLGGGTVSGNTAATGVGVLNNGTLEMANEAYLDPADDIYLRPGKTVTNTARVTKSGLVANLTVEDYAIGTRVLDGDFCAANYAKYVLNILAGSEELYINSTGYLVGREISNVAKVSVFGSYDVYYTSLQEAVDAIGTGTGLIAMVGNDTVEDTIHVRGNVTLIGDDVQDRSVVRYRTCTGAMFCVEEGAVLEFGTAGTENPTALIVDGASALYGTYGGSIVENDGTIKLNDGASLQKASTAQNGGAIVGAGDVEITGGRIFDCEAANGGAIYQTGGTLEMTGGRVVDCVSYGTGGAVHAQNVEIELCSGEISGNEAIYGGGIWAGENTTLSFMGGNVIGNKATDGGGIYVAGADFTMQGGKITVIEVDENEEMQYVEVDVTGTLSRNEAMQGGGLYVQSGSGLLAAGDIQTNTAKYGGGICVADGAALTVTGGTVSTNTANRGKGVYDAGTLYVQTQMDAFDDVYLLNGNTILPSGSAAGCVITPANYVIGTQLLSGDGVAALHGGFTISNDRYFVTVDGKLDTDTLSLKETSAMYVDYTDGVIVGLRAETDTPAEIRGQFDNASSSLSFADTNGDPIAENAIIGTNFVIRLSDGSGNVIDSKIFAMVGDVNCDGSFDGEDTVRIRSIAAGLTKEDVGAAVYRAADANSDGLINATDADLLRACGMLKATVEQP